MLNQSVRFEAVRARIVEKMGNYEKAEDLDYINKIIGTARGILEMSEHADDYAKLSILLGEGKLKREMKNPGADLEMLSKKFSFSSYNEFLDFFQRAYQPPLDIGQFGKMRPCTPEERDNFKGDIFSIHMTHGEFLTPEEDEEVKKGKKRRRGGLLFGPERDLYSFEESIKRWEHNLLLSLAIADKYNQWDKLIIAFKSMPCGQSRFTSLDNFIEDMQIEHNLDRAASNNLISDFEDSLKKQKLFSGNNPDNQLRKTPIIKQQSKTPAKHDALEKYSDMTRLNTGRVPNAKGISLIAQHLKNKYGIDVFVSENTQGVTKILDLMKSANAGVRICVQAKTGEHWYALMIEKNKNGKLNLVLMDSLGDGALTNQPPTELIDLFQEFKRTNPDFADAMLYQNIDLVQFDPDNCGIFSLKFCEHMLRDNDFVEHIKRDGYIVSAQERKEFDKAITRGRIEKAQLDEIDTLYEDGIVSYVLPPKYYAYNQRKKYVDYYRLGGQVQNEISKKAKEEIKKVMSKNEKYVFKEQVDGKVVTEVFEKSKVGTVGDKKYEVNMRAIHFRNKYWEEVIAKFDQKGVNNVNKIIQERNASHLTLEQLNQCTMKSRREAPESSPSPMHLESSHVTLTDIQSEREFNHRTEVAAALQRSLTLHLEHVELATERKKIELAVEAKADIKVEKKTTPAKKKPVAFTPSEKTSPQEIQASTDKTLKAAAQVSRSTLFAATETLRTVTKEDEHAKQWNQLKEKIMGISTANAGFFTISAHKSLLSYVSNPPKRTHVAINSLELLTELQSIANKINDNNLKNVQLKEIVKEIKSLELEPVKTAGIAKKHK